MAMHTCPVGGCERNVGPAYLMCRTDWWRVKPDVRQRVYDTFAHGTGVLTSEYREARDEAIRQAEESRTRAAAKATARG